MLKVNVKYYKYFAKFKTHSERCQSYVFSICSINYRRLLQWKVN